jgi:hypothetical protein
LTLSIVLFTIALDAGTAKPPSDEELEALIKEARARQLRRRLLGAVGVVLAAATAFVSYALVAGQGPEEPRRQRTPGPSGATVSATACARGKPRLLLSRTSGPPGTVVSVTGCGCTHPYAQADQLSWFNTRSERESARRPGLAPPYRRVPLVRTSRTTAEATLVIRRSDSVGRGLLDMLCGPASDGNAIGYFTVTR